MDRETSLLHCHNRARLPVILVFTSPEFVTFMPVHADIFASIVMNIRSENTGFPLLVGAGSVAST